MPITDDRDVVEASADAVEALTRLAGLAQLTTEPGTKADLLDQIASNILPAVRELLDRAGVGVVDFEDADADEAGSRLDGAANYVDQAARHRRP
jgi:hypothetical protein